MWDGFESRKFPRLKADCHIYLEHSSGEEPVATKTENIGIGGFCVILSKELPKLSKVKVCLDLLDGEKPIACEGRIVWTVASRTFGSDKLTHDTGVEFLDISEQARNRIKQLIGNESLASD